MRDQDSPKFSLLELASEKKLTDVTGSSPQPAHLNIPHNHNQAKPTYLVKPKQPTPTQPNSNQKTTQPQKAKT